MSTLRDAPGYAEMEDYYDSDYVPTQLVRRYEELLQERRRRTELQFIAATQAHGMHTAQDANFDRTVDSVASPLSPFQQRQPSSEQRNSAYAVLSASHRGTGLATTHPANHRVSSAPRHGPRASVALDAIYAARAMDHSSSGNTSGVHTAPSTTVQRAHTAASSSSSPGLLGTVDASTSTHTTPSRRATSKTNKKKKRRVVVSPAEEPRVRDLYDSAAEAERQERFFSESRRLGKPFVPTGGGGLDLPTRFMLGDCVKMLYRSIVPDWRVASPMVVSTAEDLVAVYFSMEKLEKAQVTALLQYMNAALLHNTAIREFHLTKVPEGWDVLTDDGYVLYTFRPPWVKKRVFLPDTVNPSHAHLREGED